MDLDKRKYFSMNPVATHIWDLLEKQLTLDSLCVKLMEDYEVEESQCKADTQEYLQEMVKLGLVKELDV